MRIKKKSGMMPVAALLLALAAPPSASGQFDSFFYIDESDYRGGGDASGTGSWVGLGDNTGGTGSWLGFGENAEGGATWEGFEDGDPLPTGGGLLVLALSGACYAVAKRRESRKLKD